jgi:starvation-inducible DNA-binding protein
MAACFSRVPERTRTAYADDRRLRVKRSSSIGDDGTNDLIVSEVIRRNELQVWFVAEHIVNAPIVEAT